MRLFSLCLTLVLPVAAALAQTPVLTPAQHQWITQHHEIRVVADADFAPIDSVGSDGREQGLAADYLKLIAARTGLTFRLVSASNRHAAMLALHEHRADLFASAFLSTQAGTAFSAPYLRLSAAIYARHGSLGLDKPALDKLDALDQRKVAVVADQAWPELLIAKGSKAKITQFADIAAALHAVQTGNADAFVGDAITTAAALERLKLRSEIDLSGQLGIEAPLAFALRADWPPLREIVDAGLKTISVDDEAKLRGRWVKSATGTNAETSADATLPATNAPAIAAALKALPEQRNLGNDARKQAEKLLHQALDDETRADQLAQQWQNQRQSVDSAEPEAQKLDDTLARDNTGALLAWRAALPERATVEQLESLLARERDAQTAARSAMATLDAEIRRQNARPAQLRDELAAAHTALGTANAAAVDATAPAPLAAAQTLRTQATQRVAMIQIALLNLENRSYEPRLRLLSAQWRERQRAVNELGQHVAALESLVLSRTGADVTELCARIGRERADVGARSRLLGETADANVTLCDQLSKTIARLGELRTHKQELDSAQQDAEQALANTQERVRIGGVTEAVGLILLAEQRKLKPLAQLKRRLADVQTELAKTRMDLIDQREQQAALADIGGVVDQTLTRVDGAPADVIEKLRAGLYRLYNTRAELVPRLMTQQTRLAAALADAERQLQSLITATDKLGSLLDSRLLWTPSHTPVNAAWFAQLPQDSWDFFASPRWPRTLTNAARSAVAIPVTSGAAILGLLVLLWLRGRAPAQLELITGPMRRIRTDHYGLTGQALMWSVLRALPLPFALWLLGKLWQHAGVNGSGFSDGIGQALVALALPAGALAFLRALTVENGLAQYHFRWPRPRREALYTAVPVLAASILPVAFLILLMARPGSDAPLGTLGRLIFALALCGTGWLCWQLLAPGRVWTLRNVVLTEPQRLRQMLRIALAAICGALVLLDLLGYFVTAQALSAHLLESLGALLGVATLYGLAVRWLVLGERRLALRRMQEKQISEETQSERGDGEDLPELPATEEITVASISAQTRRLLRALTILGSVGMLLWIWSDITPALALLGNITLYPHFHWVQPPQTDAANPIVYISLLDLLEALVLFVLTWVATRNLPGLLEVGVLRRFHVDAPTRYAVTSVTRYLIVIVGTIVGLSMLGLRWSNLQWLAAGFSVGLGFGMQEIFANFISGLIVLFERPFRIGDVISIGNTEGSVARIRTRATTLIDWDNKEVVVPNRTFITERLTNWTLSDTVTRVVLRIGAAYASDPRQVRDLLLEIAAAEPLVVKDPAPSCWFVQISACTFDFDLRVFIGEIGDRNRARSALYTRIAEVFREHGIEMAFPQTDIWFRNPLQAEAPATVREQPG